MTAAAAAAAPQQRKVAAFAPSKPCARGDHRDCKATRRGTEAMTDTWTSWPCNCDCHPLCVDCLAPIRLTSKGRKCRRCQDDDAKIRELHTVQIGQPWDE